jgi:hypothetical protein
MGTGNATQAKHLVHMFPSNVHKKTYEIAIYSDEETDSMSVKNL